MKFINFILKLSLVLLITFTTQTSRSQVKAGKYLEVKIPAPSLKGNMLGDALEQPIAIYLPPGYESSTKRYPVLYLLHGFMGNNKAWTMGQQGFRINNSMDELISAGKSKEMIIVMPSAMNKYLGSFYVNSTTNGNWDDYISRDLVSYIDANYRTLARAESRGIAGHSMGGFGSISIAMRHPDVFSAVYALSPCCLGMEGDMDFDNPAWKKTMNVNDPNIFTKQPGSFEEFFVLAFVSLSAAFSPGDKQPMYVELPFKQVDNRVVPNGAAYAQFRSKMPLYMIEQYTESLKKLRGIYLDYGQFEEFTHIRIATQKFSNELTSRGIPHVFEVYKGGDHVNKIGERLETRVMDFFSKTLDFKN